MSTKRSLIPKQTCSPYHFKFFKSCLPQILLSPFLNTLPHLLCMARLINYGLCIVYCVIFSSPYSKLCLVSENWKWGNFPKNTYVDDLCRQSCGSPGLELLHNGLSIQMFSWKSSKFSKQVLLKVNIIIIGRIKETLKRNTFFWLKRIWSNSFESMLQKI